MNLLDVQDKVLVTGGTGMVGVALQKILPHATYVGSKYDLTKLDRTLELFDEVYLLLKRLYEYKRFRSK